MAAALGLGVAQVGGFKMAPGGKSKGPPPAVKKVRSWGGADRRCVAGVAGSDEGLRRAAARGPRCWQRHPLLSAPARRC